MPRSLFETASPVVITFFKLKFDLILMVLETFTSWVSTLLNTTISRTRFLEKNPQMSRGMLAFSKLPSTKCI